MAVTVEGLSKALIIEGGAIAAIAFVSMFAGGLMGRPDWVVYSAAVAVGGTLMAGGGEALKFFGRLVLSTLDDYKHESTRS